VNPFLNAKTLEFQSLGRAPIQEDVITCTPEKGVFIIADGFGGGKAGAQAAQKACDSAKEFLEKEGGDRDATMPFVLRKYYSLNSNILFNAVLYANQEVLRLNEGKKPQVRGGCALLAGYLDGNFLSLANVGNCSAWLFRNGQVKALVQPRSYGRLQDPFLREAESSWDVPLMALGMSRDLEPEIVEVKIDSSDAILWQTDGIKTNFHKEIMTLQSKGALSEESFKDLQKNWKKIGELAANASLLISIF
jgi:serine/threonine protein phosphatase PrpC